MHAKLIIIGGKSNRQEIRLKLPTIVGRARNAGVVISHPTISRQHCELYEQSGKIFVRDLGSLNGTLVDGDQVQGSCLEHGAKFTIGPLTFQMVYEHLGPLPEEPAADEDSAIGQALAPPELAQTVVDLPRMAPVEVDFTQTAEVAATSPAATDDDGFDLALPTEDEPSLAVSETIETRQAEPAATESLKLFDAEEDDFLSAPEVEDAVAATPPAASQPAPPEAEDDFLSMIADETSGQGEAETEDIAWEVSPTEQAELDLAPEHPVEDETDWLSESPAEPAPTPVAASDEPVSTAADIDVEALFFDDAPAIPKPSAAPASAKVEDEIDWLTGDAPSATVEPLSEDDLADFGASMQSAPVEEVEAITEELSFDDAPADAEPAAPAMEPVAAAPVKPAKTKKGLWPFGRKKQADAAAPEPRAAAEIESVDTRDDAVPFSSDETIVMDLAEVQLGPAPVEEAEVAELSFDDAPTEIAEVALDEPETAALPAVEVAEPAPTAEKPKRGLFSFGRKKKSPAEAEAPAMEVFAASAEPVVEEIAAVEETAPSEAPAKKRGWFSFSKKSKSQPAEAAAAPTAEPAPKRAPAPLMPTGTTPSPESFEFSDAELEEITAETAPAKPAASADAQALAADEVLDFELDLPLDDSAASIEPVVSDEPTPTTGADDDDFLDFLAEELPGAKPKR